MSTSGSVAIALASATRRAIPPESSAGVSCAAPRNPTACNFVSTKWRIKDCGNFASGTPTCDAGDPNVYSGTLDAMSSAVALGTFAAGEQRRYQFTATFNSSAGNAYQSDSTTARFQWDAA